MNGYELKNGTIKRADFPSESPEYMKFVAKIREESSEKNFCNCLRRLEENAFLYFSGRRELIIRTKSHIFRRFPPYLHFEDVRDFYRVIDLREGDLFFRSHNGYMEIKQNDYVIKHFFKIIEFNRPFSELNVLYNPPRYERLRDDRELKMAQIGRKVVLYNSEIERVYETIDTAYEAAKYYMVCGGHYLRGDRNERI